MSTKKEFTREELDAAMRETMRRYGHRENITGVDVGYRWNGGKPTTKLCVRIHVKRKIPKTELESTELFPKAIDGIPLDVIEGRYRVTRETEPAEHRARTALLMGGFSCGRPGDGTGTIGAMVIDNETGKPAILSNWHVLAGAYARVGDPILQPGETDGGERVRDQVASLRRWMLDADGDAAIAVVDGPRRWLPLQYGAATILTDARRSVLGEILHKSGRTTGHTKGRVDGEGIYRLIYEVRPEVYEERDIQGFKLVPETPGNPDNEELSAPGDSGAFWANPVTNEAVGLHFAGEGRPDPREEHAIACHVTRVMERLNVRLASVDDVIREGDAATFGKAINRPYSLGHADDSPDVKRELSLPPDWPDYPFPWPRPFPPRPGGWPPTPYCPACGAAASDHWQAWLAPRIDRLRDDTDRLEFDRPGLAREPINLVTDIWPRLHRALVRYSQAFRSANLNSLIRDYIKQADAAYEIAAAINDSRAFEDLNLRRVAGPDFRTAATFLHVCADIATVLRRQHA